MIRRLLGHSVIYGLATLASRGSLLVLLLVLPFILEPAEYGVLAMVAALSTLVNVVVPMEITQAVVRLYPTAEGNGPRIYASTAWWFTLLMVVLFLAATQAAAVPLCRWILGGETHLFAFRIGLAVMALTTLFYFIQNQFRWEFRTGEYAAVGLFFSLATLGLSLGLGLASDRPLEGVLTGQAAGAALAILFAGWKLRASIADRLEIAKLKEMLRISLPIVPASLSLLLSLYAGRFILNDLAGLDAVGIFTFASQVAGIAGLTLVGVQAAVTPLIMAHFDEPETAGLLGRSFEMFAGLALAACLLLGLFAPELIEAFGEPAYRGSGPFVLPLSLAVVAGGMYFFLPGFLIGKKTGRQMWVSMASAAASIALNYLLAARFGLAGAVAATLLSSLVFTALWFVFSQPFYPVPIRWGRVALASIATLGGGMAAVLADYPGLGIALLVKSVVAAALIGLILLTGLLPLRQGFAAVREMLARLRRGGEGTAVAEAPRP